MNRQRAKTQTLWGLQSQFNELHRFYLSFNEHTTGIVHFKVFTTKTYGGKRLLGKAQFPLSVLVSNVISPATIFLDENEHGMIVLQSKFVPKKNEHGMIVLQSKFVPKKILMGSGKKKTRQMRTELQFLTLRQRHTTEDLVLKQRLFDLKEANVNKDYPCLYDGLDSVGRVCLRGLELFIDRVTDDIFSVVKSFGALAYSISRPLSMLSLEQAQYKAFRESEGVLCAGRYEILKEAQEYILKGAPNTILAITGPSGAGKSNIMAALDKMFREGWRVQANPSTKLLQLVETPGFEGKKRGASWDKPEVASIFIGLSNGNTTPRFFLHTLMSALADILKDCTCQIEPSLEHKVLVPPQDSTKLACPEHKVLVPPQDSTKLTPIPNEFNVLRLQFLTLCLNIGRFLPHKKIVILFDQVNEVKRMRFDWLPTILPKKY
ncbi:hypothetical protein T484DRAFT_1838453 [Baffinella frigidus]|nr:hypothetical protein T484DRAFT_1838453 [Cryptophyta sp. CCMP2293]